MTDSEPLIRKRFRLFRFEYPVLNYNIIDNLEAQIISDIRKHAGFCVICKMSAVPKLIGEKEQSKRD